MAKLDESKVKHILSTLENLEFGSIVITVHNGEITQIDATEKKRFSLQKPISTQNTK
ncbi:YezD family protein [Bacillus sp. JJ1562]|uniref:YezD family protein n=1 Tax=Bacillus sp. JJ1562 TaxID=3122960 RepID=UPI0030010C03